MLAGLTTAALLARQGERVLVLEQHDQAGGCTHDFEEEGVTFDTGLHYLGGHLDDRGSSLRRRVDTWSAGLQNY